MSCEVAAKGGGGSYFPGPRAEHVECRVGLKAPCLYPRSKLGTFLLCHPETHGFWVLLVAGAGSECRAPLHSGAG